MSDHSSMANNSSNEREIDSNDTTLEEEEDAVGGANNSLIGKVKSRVSSILPNSLSKWFSPSSRDINDAQNGSLGGVARRRRPLEVDDEEDEEGEEECLDEEEDDDDIPDDEQPIGEYVARNLRRRSAEDEESNNSEEENLTDIYKPGNWRSTGSGRPPPPKRQRLNANTHESLLLPSQPLVASTPASSSNMRNNVMHPISGRATQVFNSNRYKQLNVYGQQSNREPAYKFHGPDTNSGISSRRSLNIAAVTQTEGEQSIALRNLKRQSVASVRQELLRSSAQGNTQSYLNTRHMPTSKTNRDTEIGGSSNDDTVTPAPTPKALEESTEANMESVSGGSTPAATSNTKYNGRSTLLAYAIDKSTNLTNGTENLGEAVGVGSTAEDSGSERSSEGGGACNAPVSQPRSGLFNMSALNSRNCSRTSSLGTGLNFYTHLEGRKSLFSGPQATAIAGGSALNNSTLSLTSLNRRQFNASIYGSTSALSDSRLLNTFSPFYKGKTTYGGAAAYKCARGASTGAGASAVRIIPTLIRPTSSLSTLSSSSNSLAAAGATNETPLAMSSTAKRILELINDFPTPLSEAKKMATSIKTRLNDTDLHNTRAMRLSQVRTPYMRPNVILQPNHMNGKVDTLPPVRELQVPSMSQLLQVKKMQSTTERSRQITMKNSSSYKKATAQVSGGRRTPPPRMEYTLPVDQKDGCAGDSEAKQIVQRPQNQQQQHVNKIKHKVASSGRVTRSKGAAGLVDDTLPTPVNLPNIAFPMMQSLPKFDTQLSLPASSPSLPARTMPLSAKPALESGFKLVSSKATAATTHTGNAISVSRASTLAFKTNSNTVSQTMTAPSLTPKGSNTNLAVNSGLNAGKQFKFSAPLELQGVATTKCHNAPSTTGDSNYTFKFSPPIMLHAALPTPPKAMQSAPQLVPQLKTGSVLDALKKPFTLPPTITVANNSFGNQFKKSNNEWDCDVCMVRNKVGVNQCMSCTTPRKGNVAACAASTTISPQVPLNSTFGNQFKKSANEWECDVCMVRNKVEMSECVSCSTPRKSAAAPHETVTSTVTNVQGSWGDAFKPSANTWECTTCLIRNQSGSNECVSCQTKRPGAKSSLTASSSQMKFGFAAAQTSVNQSTDFKTIAKQQQQARWTCDACMTPNDVTRVKCVCCEETKPGVPSENVPKIAFGSTAAAKFTFGFGASAARKDDGAQQTTPALRFGNGPTETPTTLVTTTTVAKTSASFTFGFKPIATTASADKGTTTTVASSGFQLGLSKVSEKAADQDVAAAKVTFSLPTTTDAAPIVQISAPSTTAPTPIFGCGTNLAAKTGATNAQAPTAHTTATTLSAPSTVGGFKFSSTPSSKASMLNNFTFGAPKTTAAESTTATISVAQTAATTVAVVPMLSFSTISAATTSTVMPSSTVTTTPVFGATFVASTTAATVTSASLKAAATNTFGAAAVTTVSSSNNSYPNASIFGQPASVSNNKPTAAATAIPIISTANAAPFVFGSSLMPASAVSTTTIAPAPTTTANTWSKSGYVFGVSVGSSNTSTTTATPVFGASPTSASTAMTGTSLFGSAAAVASSGSATSVFGSMQSGTGTSLQSATPFGNSAVTNAFSVGGGTESVAAVTPSAVFGSPAPATKKPELPFSFSTTGAFSFGSGSSASPKPAFNFGASSQPSFNFSGPAPTPNAPYQFSASGTVPPTGNIFAPTMAPGVQSTALQARRKIRQTTRRTPR